MARTAAEWAAYMRDYRAARAAGRPKRGQTPKTIEYMKARTVENGIGCWIWQGNSGGGYGHVKFDGLLTTAHRAAWIMVNGPIPTGLVLRHYICGNPPCINPEHMMPGTQAENQADRTLDIHRTCSTRIADLEAEVKHLKQLLADRAQTVIELEDRVMDRAVRQAGFGHSRPAPKPGRK